MTHTNVQAEDAIYLDYAASTPIDPRVVEKMHACLSSKTAFANPSSLSHSYGERAAKLIEKAQYQVANLVKADPQCIIWTSGATESNNLAIKGVALAPSMKGKHIITLQTEHRSILDSCAFLAEQGFQITYLKPLSSGLIDIAELTNALRPETCLVSLMHVNNETGVIQDIAAISDVLKKQEVIFHVDAVQSVGKLPIDLQKMPVDLMSFSAHKIYGPKGIGALYIKSLKPGMHFAAQILGGGQQAGLRSGTLATHQIVGMGEAFQVAEENFLIDTQKMKYFCEKILSSLQGRPGWRLNGHVTQRLSNILNLCFENRDKEQLSRTLRRFAVSGAAACAVGSQDTSHVLRAMGLKSELAHRSIRFSWGRFTTENEIDELITVIKEEIL